jgi:TPR repeat protein
MGNVGYLFLTGTGTGKDLFQAASWARKAAGLPQTTARAMNDLGAMYEEGGAVTQDLAEAAKWYGKAAARGYPGAAANLARAKSGKAGAPTVLAGLEY